jgi:D-proline reductase (dithiol) PrdB
MNVWKYIDRFNARTVVKLGGFTRALIRLLPLRPADADGDIPFTRLAKPLAECTVALVTSCGVHLPSQECFDMEARGGDPTYREYLWDEITGGYVVSHSHFDPRGIMKDLNVAIPGDRLEELAARGIIGALHPVVYSFMGYIPKSRPLVRRYAPEVADSLARAKVDIAILTPC